MRTHVIDRLVEKARLNDRIVLVVGDLGFNVVEKFAEEFPDRFVNCGIAEQNMMSVAAGMALEGDIVFVYSIGNFPTLRCMEQIRNNVCYHGANVNILSVGGGFSYGTLGVTHHTTEELGMLRALPNMRVYAPADYYEAVPALDEAIGCTSPTYIRLARGSDAVIHTGEINGEISKLVPFDEYNEKRYDATIITTGTILDEAINAAQNLLKYSIKARVFSCPTIKPIDYEGILQLGKTSEIIVTVEEHNVMCGLGGVVAEVLSSMHKHAPLLRMGLNDEFSSAIGTSEYLRKNYKIDSDSIVKKILESLVVL